MILCTGSWIGVQDDDVAVGLFRHSRLDLESRFRNVETLDPRIREDDMQNQKISIIKTMPTNNENKICTVVSKDFPFHNAEEYPKN